MSKKTEKPKKGEPRFRRGDIVTGGSLGTNWDGTPIKGIVVSSKGDRVVVEPITSPHEIAESGLTKV